MVLLTLGAVRYAWLGNGTSLPLPVQAPTALPFSPSWVDGLINAGGQIVPQVDIAKRLNLPTFMPTALWHDRERGIALPVSDCELFVAPLPPELSKLSAQDIPADGIITIIENAESPPLPVLHPRLLTLPEPGLPPLGNRILGNEPIQETHTALHPAIPLAFETERSLLLVQVGQQRYGLPLTQVQEVLEAPTWFATHTNQPACLGRLPLRQAVLPVFSLAALLKQETTTPPKAGLVVLYQHQPVALLCDAIIGIEKIRHTLQNQDEHDTRWRSWCYTHNTLTAELDLTTLLAHTWQAPTHTPLPASIETNHLHFVVFRLGTETWLLPLTELVQAAEFQSVTPVPLQHIHQQTDALTQIQGEILPVLDLRRYFAMPTSNNNNTAFLLVKPAGETLALTVDKILRVMSSPSTHFERVEQRRQPWLQGFVHNDAGLFPVLSPAGLLVHGGT